MPRQAAFGMSEQISEKISETSFQIWRPCPMLNQRKTMLRSQSQRQGGRGSKSQCHSKFTTTRHALRVANLATAVSLGS